MLSRNYSFLVEEKKDHKGRSFKDYLSFSPSQFEEEHDFIQWAFPTDQKSSFNSQSETLTRGDAVLIRCSFRAQMNLSLLWGWARTMYSFKIRLVRTHNELRASRIIRSLSILSHDNCDLGLESYEFFQGSYLLEVSETAGDFWYKNRMEGKDLWR